MIDPVNIMVTCDQGKFPTKCMRVKVMSSQAPKTQQGVCVCAPDNSGN